MNFYNKKVKYGSHISAFCGENIQHEIGYSTQKQATKYVFGVK